MVSQVGIGTANPASTLDITSSTTTGSRVEGVLIPRVSRSKAQAMTGITESTLIYVNTLDATATGNGTNITSLGFYYFDPTILPIPGKWVKVQTGTESPGWLLTGNTVSSTDFLGTVNNLPLKFKVNNANAGYIDSGGAVFLGLQSGNVNTQPGNVGIGNKTLINNTTGNNNSALGAGALLNNIGGNANTAIGSGALNTNTTGNSNTAIGVSSLANNVSGRNNTALGNNSLQMNNSGRENTALGYSSLNSNTTADLNTAIGTSALFTNTIGSENTAVGHSSLYTNSSGKFNTAVGNSSLFSNSTGSSNTGIGEGSLYSNTIASGNVAIGNVALRNNTVAQRNVAVGTNALFQQAFSNSNVLYNSNNTAIGYESLFLNAPISVATGINNTGLGAFSGRANSTGSNNVAIGYNALLVNSTGSQNTAVGANVNSAIGDFTNTTALGYNSANTGSNQVRIGNTAITSIGGQVGWTTLSDKRFKKNVKENIPGLEFIKKLKPVSYTIATDEINNFIGIKDKGKVNTTVYSGFLAQDVEKAALEVGYEFSGVDKPQSEKDYYGLRYAEFVVPLTKAIQEQQKMIEELKLEIDNLKKMKE